MPVVEVIGWPLSVMATVMVRPSLSPALSRMSAIQLLEKSRLMGVSVTSLNTKRIIYQFNS